MNSCKISEERSLTDSNIMSALFLVYQDDEKKTEAKVTSIKCGKPERV